MLGCQVLFRLGILAALALAGVASQPAVEQASTDPNVHSPWRQQVGSLISFRGNKPVEPQFCVIVRTYWGHSGGQHMGLRRLIRSLQRQTVKRWEAIFLVMDDKPFLDLHHILSEFKDDRLWVFAEWVGTQFMPKKDANEWMPGYHGMLYNLTDDAIQVCPKDTRWLIITNGDNEYAENFMQKVMEAGDTDIVAFDFYSRFQRPTAPACERFGAWSDRPACKPNRLKWCHTDLGANVINYPKFMTEQRRFGTLQSELGLQEDHYDGIMAQALVVGGWRVATYEGLCLFSHAPNPQWCGWQGGVWDDTDIVSWTSAGGRCIGWDEREQMLANEDIEEVVVRLSNDGNVSVFEGVQPGHMEIRCLRKRDTLAEQLRAMHWYSTWCTEDADLPGFEYLMATHGSQAPIQEQQVPAHPDIYELQAQFYQLGAAATPEQPPQERPEGWQPELRQRYDPPPEDLASQAEQQLIWQQEMAAQAEHIAALHAAAVQAASEQQQHLHVQQHFQQPQLPQEWPDVAMQQQQQQHQQQQEQQQT